MKARQLHAAVLGPGLPFPGNSKRFFAFVIFLNAIFIGVQSDAAAQTADSESSEFFILQNCFTVLFLGELVVRMLAEGRAFFWSSTWNLVDFVLVLFSLVEFALTCMASVTASDTLAQSSNLRIFRIIRITRLAKVVRMVRLVRFIRALRVLVFSILSTLRSLVWSLLLLISISYVFGVVFTDVVSTHLKEHPGPWDGSSAEALLSHRFGSLLRSMLTMYASILDGISWLDIAVAFEHISWFWCLLFICYVSFCAFAVLNVVTGVFCQSAIESAQRDHDMVVQSMMRDKEFYLEGLQKLFKAIDDDSNGAVTIKEFEAHFNDAAVRNLFEALGLDPADAWSLFSACDTDGDYTLNAEEFLEGAATAIDLANIKKEVHKMRKSPDERRSTNPAK